MTSVEKCAIPHYEWLSFTALSRLTGTRRQSAGSNPLHHGWHDQKISHQQVMESGRKRIGEAVGCG
jgi:hypothetical protein